MTTGIVNPVEQPLRTVPRPFLLLFLSPASMVIQNNSDPTVWETETESGKDGIVKKDYSDDEDVGRGTSVIEDSDGKEDEDA